MLRKVRPVLSKDFLDALADHLPRRLCDVARHLVNAGDPRACRVSRRWLSSKDALTEALGTGAPEPEDNPLLTELGLEKV